MSVLSFGFSAITKLAAIAFLLAGFLAAMVGVVYLALQGDEIRVPEIVGKNFSASERELTALGLKIKRRAERPGNGEPNTILEQLPKAGETVKTGQLILVVTSSQNIGGEEVPATLKKSLEEDDTQKIEEMISEKPRRSRTNSNVNKKTAETTRDISANAEVAAGPANTIGADQGKKETGTDDNKQDQPPTRPSSSPAAAKPSPNKPAAEKPR